MERISIDLETFNKIMNVLGQLPYAQVAELLQEVSSSVEKVEVSPGANLKIVEDDGD